MPLLKQYSLLDVETAIARSNGVSKDNISTADNFNRDIRAQDTSPYRKGTGHVYAHVATYTERSGDASMTQIRTNQNAKSLWQNRRDAIAACTDMLNNSTKVQRFLSKFDNPAQRAKYTSPVDVKNNDLTGDFYGYPAGGSALMKVTAAAINIYEVGGSLVIFSAYPISFVAFEEPSYDLDALFTEGAFDNVQAV